MKLTLERIKDKRICTCDECGEELKDHKGLTFKFENDEFDVFRERLHEEGWKAIKDGNEWSHICPDCQ